MPTRYSGAAEDWAADVVLGSEAAGAEVLAEALEAASGLPGLRPIPDMDIIRHRRRPHRKMSSMPCKQRHNT